MQIEFENENLLELYTKGKNKKYPLSASIVRKFTSRIEVLDAAITIYDLWRTTSLHFEKIKSCDNRFSIRIDKKYRLEIEIEWSDEHKTHGIVKILEISKHYE